MFQIGLDNGVIVRGVKRKDLPRFIKYPFEKDYNDGVEVCYWRKCWGLRNWFLRTAFPNRSADEWEFKCGVTEITYLWRIVIHYLENPEDWDNSIWDFDEIKSALKEQKRNLFWLRIWMKLHPDAEVIFYDSY